MKAVKINKKKLNYISNNIMRLNNIGLYASKKWPGYGVDNFLWDNGTNILWDNGGVVLTDKKK